MAQIPLDEKFICLSASVDTTERRSALINAQSQAYTMQDIIDTVPSGPAYKVYTAIITQFGTNAPIVTVLQNTIGPISFQYVGVGMYNAVSAGLFIEGKTFAFIGSSPDGNSHASIASSGGGQSDFRGIQSFINGVFSNNAIGGAALEIRVYN
jgi:hypothetical protein